MATLTPATPDFLDTAPFRVVTEATVSAPIDSCWSLLVDAASWVQWFKEMSAVEATPWIWTEVGQTRRVTVNGLRVNETAISLDPQREYAFTITKWPLPIAKRAAEGVRLEDRTDGGSPRTHLTYIGAFESTSMGKRAESTLESQLISGWGGGFKRLGALASQRATAQAVDDRG